MNTRRLFIPLISLIFIVTGATAASAQNWHKLGQKDVNFTIDHDTISTGDRNHIREIHMQVKYAPVKLRRVVINYKDGTHQEVEYLEDLTIGRDSRSITVEGTGKVIHNIDLWYETAAMTGKKAKITVYGRS